MSASNTKQLHWTQRVALVRHSLHTASRSGEFTFFKSLQAAAFIEGTNHAAILTASIGDGADTVLTAMDNLNTGLAYVHQDAFKNVYDNVRNSMRAEEEEAIKSKLYVDITMQKNTANMAIDKMSSSAIALINQQPEHVKDTAASVWITGATIVADTMEIALREMDSLDFKMDDFIRLEESWNTVKASVICSITGLKGVYSLMDPSNPQTPQTHSTRSASIASASGAVFRRLSTAFTGSANTGPSPTHSRQSSLASTASAANSNFANWHRNSSVSSMNAQPVYRTPSYVRSSVSNGCPTSMPPGGGFNFEAHKLSMVPPTPAALEYEADPFDTSVPPVPEISAAMVAGLAGESKIGLTFD